MPRVTWDSLGTRTFHTGVDRGMLYTDPSVAVPWPGLVSVTEAPVGGDAQPFYLDGRKVSNRPSGESFGATIEAMSAPQEFASCAGKLRLSPGLYAGDQPKPKFDFSYRTLIGNDVQGAQFGYKLHLVFGATAQVTDVTRGTINAGSAAATRSWNISTVPLTPKGYRPTSHFIFDSRYTNVFTRTRLENMLYGDSNSDPHMPTLVEIQNLLAGTFDVTWWDLSGGQDFPDVANAGDMGVDFTSDVMYGDDVPDSDAYWWDLTGDLPFPAEARPGDWGYDTITGQVWRNIG